ncbi:hypothetical protein D3C85_1432500 [compost metagenome]
MPINCGGIRKAASMSSRLMFLIEPNSSFAATSLTGISWMPSFFPPGAYMNRLRKLPGPFADLSAERNAATSVSFCAVSVMYMMKPAWLPLL